MNRGFWWDVYSGLWRLWKCTDVRLQYLHMGSDSVCARCRIRRLTRGQVSAEAESLRLLFRRLALLLLASPHALLFPVLGPQLLFVSVSCLLAVVIWIMSALFVIYLFIFSIGTCFRFDCHEDTFAWLMVQLFFMGVLSSAHLFGESWRIFKQHKARHTLIRVVCVRVFVFDTQVFFFFATWRCLARLATPFEA